MNAADDNAEHRDASRYLISAPETATLVRDALRAGKNDLAVRMLTEAVARLIEVGASDLPGSMLTEPETTGDHRYDVVLATEWLYALNLTGVEAPAWTGVNPLDGDEWLWGGGGFESSEYRDLVRQDTPEEFLRVGVLTRRRDWVNA